MNLELTKTLIRGIYLIFVGAFHPKTREESILVPSILIFVTGP